ncbi:MAG TPA: thioesterase family protein [Candidatus Sulfotelmatobacter sp.]|jgi:fluoroacetyl-CoA thioesterase|nr:thioesterase family protein [Candidatus Sulfotelmatobacter sp.]
MSRSLIPGLTHSIAFTVPREKTVPFLYPESEQFARMPEVFATGFMVGLMEWCCIDLIAPHLAEGEGSLGTLVEVSHEAATPPGMTVTVEAVLDKIDGRQLFFQVIARDEVDVIGRGRHGRTLVNWQRFTEKVAKKAG